MGLAVGAVAIFPCAAGLCSFYALAHAPCISARGNSNKIFCYSNCSPELKLDSILVMRGVS